ncbi:MAG TPA: LacI family DNA-binding transcriptional regulator [Caulobacteraceae bacterium]|jgi:LacI family transcriptional regulator
MKVTLYEVAARAGVSIATVSRALNGLPVSPASRAKVNEAAAALGYVANEAARALRNVRTQTMGLIFFDLRNTLGIELVDAIGEAIEASGYSLLIASARADRRRYDLLMHRFLERRIDALFCINPRGQAETLPRYTVAGTPVIALFAAGSAYSDLPLITPSFTDSSRALAAHLSSLGHAQVALVADEPRSPSISAVAEALKAASVGVEWIAPSQAGGMSETLAALMRRDPWPTAVVTLDQHARSLLAACAAAGVAVPETLNIVSVSEITADTANRRAGVSSLVIDPNRMGRASAGAMLAWLAGSRPANRISVQAATWEPRASIGQAANPVRRAS